MTTGERIRFFRKDRGLTQAELAERAGIHEVTIRKYESGKLHPTPEQVVKLAEALQVTTFAIDKTVGGIDPICGDGDLKGLFVRLCRGGIVSFVGTRGADGLFEKETFSIRVDAAVASVIGMTDDMLLKVSDRLILDDLLNWERHKYLYDSFLEEYDPDDSLARANLELLKERLDKFELDIQINKFCL